MPPTLAHLHEHPALRPAVATAIWTEFWSHGQGYRVGDLEALLAQAGSPDHLPLCRIALDGERLLGSASLIDNDDPARPHLWPWLAAVWVAPAARGRGVGSALVRAVVGDAARLGIPRLYLGTDQPGWYARFGAVFHAQARPDLQILQMPVVADR